MFSTYIGLYSCQIKVKHAPTDVQENRTLAHRGPSCTLLRTFYIFDYLLVRKELYLTIINTYLSFQSINTDLEMMQTSNAIYWKFQLKTTYAVWHTEFLPK